MKVRYFKKNKSVTICATGVFNRMETYSIKSPYTIKLHTTDSWAVLEVFMGNKAFLDIKIERAHTIEVGHYDPYSENLQVLQEIYKDIHEDIITREGV